MANDQGVAGSPQFTECFEFAEIVQQVAELREVGRPFVPWKDATGHLECERRYGHAKRDVRPVAPVSTTTPATISVPALPITFDTRGASLS